MVERDAAADLDIDAWEGATEMIQELREWFTGADSVLVAYSGGVDSTLLLAVAHEQLGEKAVGCMGISPSLSARSRLAALETAAEMGAEVIEVETNELAIEEWASNGADRCYYCKNNLYALLSIVAKKRGLNVVVDGTNADDPIDDRPGMRAANEHHVLSPLRVVGFRKKDVRLASRRMGLDGWDRPANACLASRIPRFVTITRGLLAQVEEAEVVLADLGFEGCRVRHEGRIARIEMPSEKMGRAVEMRDLIVSGVREAGFENVCLDLTGYRPSGRLEI